MKFKVGDTVRVLKEFEYCTLKKGDISCIVKHYEIRNGYAVLLTGDSEYTYKEDDLELVDGEISDIIHDFNKNPESYIGNYTPEQKLDLIKHILELK